MELIWNNALVLYIIGSLALGGLIGFILMNKTWKSNEKASMTETVASIVAVFVGLACLMRATNLTFSSDGHAIMDVLGIILL